MPQNAKKKLSENETVKKDVAKPVLTIAQGASQTPSARDDYKTTLAKGKM